MSFSGDVKQELARHISEARHCMIAEIAALIQMAGEINISEASRVSIKFQIENAAVARKYFTLIKKTFRINTEVSLRRNTTLKKNQIYILYITDHKACMKILQATGIMEDTSKGIIRKDINSLTVQKTCCRRAYLRGAFLGSGSVSDPEKGYHLEFVNSKEEYAVSLKDLINKFGMDAKIVMRKNNYVAYLKEGAQIVDLLNIMGAHVALMELENIRIIKEMRNNVNRLVNCETANINKTVSAAVRQVQDITYLEGVIGLSALPRNLEEISKYRMQYPSATLKELGEKLTPPVGKSGVNHRLRKLSELANQLREERGGN
ncbi:MAG TPA: DNA-binding protein WhiA [Epulopiscium sp.]|nr:DNA-binding protein WhiA [Candidatus Epulonipiscium sp.]